MDRLRRGDDRRGDRRSVAVLAAFVLVGLTACQTASDAPASDSAAPEVPQPAVTAPVAAAPTSPVVTAPATTAPPVVEPAPAPDPAAPPVWENLFVDHFDGPAGTPAGQWHTMTGWNDATLDGNGRLEVGRLAQIRSTSGWVLPVGTRVRVSASLVMPDTSSNYAAIWVQHPNPADPREIDVIESYGPKKTGGAPARLPPLLRRDPGRRRRRLRSRRPRARALARRQELRRRREAVELLLGVPRGVHRRRRPGPVRGRGRLGPPGATP